MRTSPARSTRGLRALLSAIVAMALVAAASGCSLVDSVGSAAPDTTLPARGGYPTTVATAIGPELEVFATRPGSSEPTPDIDADSQRAPIPRAGLNSAGVRKTSTGWVFDNPTYYGSPLVNVVTGEDDGWLKVMVAARPNGQEGWVRASDVTLSEHNYHGELQLAERNLRFWDGDQLLVDTDVVVGRDVTPTPVGRVFVNETLDTAAIGASQVTYGPWLLSTSAYSEALDIFDEGLPVIAFHGTGNPELIGTAASNGCVRMTNDVVTLLAQTLPAGTPIEILP